MTRITSLGKNSVKLVRVAHGLMTMTYEPLLLQTVNDEVCFQALRTSLDSAGPGEKVLLNTGMSYSYCRLHHTDLLGRFFAAHPDYASKAFISLKGGIDVARRCADATPEKIRQDLKTAQEILGPHKSIDHFVLSRIDDNIPVEDAVGTLQTIAAEDKSFEYLGLCETTADTLRRACKAGPVPSVEIEVSPWTYGQEVQDVIATAGELGVTVFAYSPLGKGFLTGAVTQENLGDYHMLSLFPRFAADAMKENQKIVDLITTLAEKKGVTNAQMCIAWVASLGEHVIPLPGSSNASRTAENFAAVDIVLTPEEKIEMDQVVRGFEAVGHRYPEILRSMLMK
ncbi:aldo/keto reductase [Clavulina sp. PMI_390]|nr:aldo/keto reductase [Clavulina sp. PMI_390]